MVERRVGSHQNNFFQSLRISVIQEAGDLDFAVTIYQTNGSMTYFLD